jgi:hypothetical protein
VTSAKKVAANRQNARRSTGPKTVKGKDRASRNAMRHGLETIGRHNPSVSAQIEHIARAICGDAASPAQYEQALIIAESEVVLLHVRTARVAAIEPARKDAPSSSVLVPGFPSDREWERAFDHLVHGRPRDVATLLVRGADAVRIFSARMFSVEMSASPDDEKKTEQVGQGHRESAAQGDGGGDMSTSRNPSLIMAGSELDALRRALPDLMSYDRYARRASSRRRRAIRNFIANSVLEDLLDDGEVRAKAL